MTLRFLGTLILFFFTSLVYSQTKKDASYYYLNFEYKQAAEIWENSIAEHPLSKEDRIKLLNCYLFTNQSKKGLDLVMQMRSENSSDSLSGYAAQFAFLERNYPLALTEQQKAAKLSLPRLFEANCLYSMKDTFSLKGTIENHPSNSKNAELLYRCGNDWIVLQEEGKDSLLAETKLSGNFDEVFFLRPYHVKNGKQVAWNIFGNQNLNWSLNSIQIDHKRNKAYFSITKPLELTRNLARPQLYQANFTGFGDPLSDIQLLKTDLPLNQCGAGHVALNETGDYLVAAIHHDTATSSNLVLLHFDGTSWNFVRNITELNTAGDELYPHFVNDSILRYSTNGLPCFGNLDSYEASFSKELFTNIRHLSFPINSHSDDFLVYGEASDTVYFSSNRADGNDDLFTFFPTIEKIIPPLAIKAKTILPDSLNPQFVYFEYNKSEVTFTLKSADLFKIVMEENPEWIMTLTGHTDARGSAEYNQYLGLKRANLVRDELIRIGIDAKRIVVKSNGEKFANQTRPLPDPEAKKDRFVRIELR
ncbi:OmpA family protein [Fluviicola sp.]|uniref:OmpA family protein n=1 Tax=Fluviicola sp. TaxID=1917219 RepID=UPI003D26E693